MEEMPFTNFVEGALKVSQGLVKLVYSVTQTGELALCLVYLTLF